jgi:glycosyltransferase involved in cell wall biosynthesis
VLLAAAPRVLARRPRTRFVLAGGRVSAKPEVVAFERDIIAAAERAPLRGRVTLFGWRDDVPALLRDADVVVSCARQEPLGVVILEAMATAAPIVGTAVGGTTEPFDHGTSGLLVPGVAKVVPLESLLDEAMAIARQIASQSPLAVRLAKQALNRVEDLPLKEAYRLEQDYTMRLGLFEDTKEAMDAFLEKREAKFKGR